MHNAKLAKLIAQKILTASGPGDKDVVCNRVQLMKGSLGNEANMGGRNETSLINCILGGLYTHRT